LLKRTDWLVLALGLTVVLQAAEISLGSRLRWSPMEWQSEWFRVKISERLQREPVLYLSMSTTTGAFLAPFVAPGSGMMNISGAYTLAPDGPGGARAVALIDRFGTRLRTLDRVTRKLKDGTPLALPADITDTRLQRFGLRVDPDDCEFISYEDSPGLEAGSALAFDRRGQRETNYYQTCAIRRDGVDLKAYMAERAAIDKVLDRVEDACPDLFRPRRMMTEHNGPTWRRVYVNTDNELWIWDGWIKYLNGVLGGVPLVIGPASEWEQGPRAIDCSRKSALGGSALIESR